MKDTSYSQGWHVRDEGVLQYGVQGKPMNIGSTALPETAASVARSRRSPPTQAEHMSSISILQLYDGVVVNFGILTTNFSSATRNGVGITSPGHKREAFVVRSTKGFSPLLSGSGTVRIWGRLRTFPIAQSAQHPPPVSCTPHDCLNRSLECHHLQR